MGYLISVNVISGKLFLLYECSMCAIYVCYPTSVENCTRHILI